MQNRKNKIKSQAQAALQIMGDTQWNLSYLGSLVPITVGILEM